MRKFLRLPGDKIYTTLVNSPYEWVIITDPKLRIITVERGNLDNISLDTFAVALIKTSGALPKNKITPVLVLHTHPHMLYNAPSMQDLRVYVGEKLKNSNFGLGKLNNINIVGFGQVSERGVMIITVPPEPKRLHNLRNELEFGTTAKRGYLNNVDNRMRRINYDTYKKSAVNPEQLTHTEKTTISRVHTEEFKRSAKSLKDMNVRKATRNRLGRIHRRRGR